MDRYGIERAGEHRLDGIYNLGTGESCDFNTVVELLNEELGTDIDPVYVETPFEDYVHDTQTDSMKMAEAIGWEPRISFEEGIERVWEPSP